RLWITQRRHLAESFEWLLDPGPARGRLREALWEIARGPASSRAPSEAELGRKYVSLLSENLGQPGFRELILRAADLETGGPPPFRRRHGRSRGGGARARWPTACSPPWSARPSRWTSARRSASIAWSRRWAIARTTEGEAGRIPRPAASTARSLCT